MSAQIVALLNHSVFAQLQAKDSARVWLTTEHEIEIAPALKLKIELEHVDDEWQIRATFNGPGVKDKSYHLPPETHLDASRWAGLHIVPRAIEFTNGEPSRCLMEFIPARSLCVAAD
jgi:hypothetical protein